MTTGVFVSMSMRSTSATLGEPLNLAERPPMRGEDRTQPPALCANESEGGVRAGPPTASASASLLTAFLSQSGLGYASESMKAKTSPLAMRMARFLFAPGGRGPEGITFAP